MTDNSEEWGPWIEHDGKGCPVVGGTVVHVIHVDGMQIVCISKGRPPNKYEVNCWDWADCNKKKPESKIIRYRIRKPRGMKVLQELVENPPEKVDA